MTQPRTYRPAGVDATTTQGISGPVNVFRWAKARAASLGITFSYFIVRLIEAERDRVEKEDKAA